MQTNPNSNVPISSHPRRVVVMLDMQVSGYFWMFIMEKGVLSYVAELKFPLTCSHDLGPLHFKNPLYPCPESSNGIAQVPKIGEQSYGGTGNVGGFRRGTKQLIGLQRKEATDRFRNKNPHCRTIFNLAVTLTEPQWTR